LLLPKVFSSLHIGNLENAAMLLGATNCHLDLQDRSCARQALVNNTIESVQACFPSITIRLLDNVSAINAQASRITCERTVDLFAGLAFHPAIGAEALTFSLLHEVGHHLGCGARMTPASPLACDCAADRWAILEGLPALARINGNLDVGLAMAQLENALPPRHESVEGSNPCDCWLWDWARRTTLYLTMAEIPAIERCLMFR
jgi:hypothetical protein